MPKRILVVDDHAATRSLIRAVLDLERKERYEVVEAASGAQCLQAIDTQGPFDLVLLDVEMPDANGYDVCRSLRKAGVLTPVVFVTSRTQLADFQRGREAGGDSYVVKPISRAALKSIVGVFTSVSRRTPDAGEGG